MQMTTHTQKLEPCAVFILFLLFALRLVPCCASLPILVPLPNVRFQSLPVLAIPVEWLEKWGSYGVGR